ncbi:MAG: hypothetical protein Q4D96_00840 [Propionibacteriaceae bacterium]|nr:hypothetical protein [Propionibacteriaceae bacterium]
MIAHEARRTLPILGVIHGIATLSILTGNLLVSLRIPVLSELAVLLVVVLLCGTWFASQIWLAHDFWSTGFGERGYLTHSLPVKGSLILRARLLWAGLIAAFAAVWMAVMVIVTIPFMVPVMTPGKDGWETLATGLRLVGEVVPLWQLITLALLMWFSLWGGQVNLYFAASLGSTPPLVRLGIAGPILVWAGTWLVTQVLGFASLLIPLAYTDRGSGMKLEVVNVLEALAVEKDLPFIPVGWIPLVGAGIIAMVIWMRHIWNRRISLW